MAFQWEYCIVEYNGYFYQINYLYFNGQELKEWEGKSFVLFLNRLGEQGWEMSGYSPGHARLASVELQEPERLTQQQSMKLFLNDPPIFGNVEDVILSPFLAMVNINCSCTHHFHYQWRHRILQNGISQRLQIGILFYRYNC